MQKSAAQQSPNTSSTESSNLHDFIISPDLEPEVRNCLKMTQKMTQMTSNMQSQNLQNFTGIALVTAIRGGQMKDYKTVSEALAAGLLQNLKGLGIESRLGANPTIEEDGMSLSEAVAKGLVDSETGKVTDRYSGKSVKLSDAIKRGLINPNTLEIFPPALEGQKYPSQKLSLKEALEKNIINETTGNYADTMSLQEASQKKLISAPMTIKECDDSELLSDKGIKCPATGLTMTLLDAIGSGVIDVDLKSVKDVKEGVLVSLSQALAKDIIISEFGQDTPGPVQFKDTQTNEVMTLPEAVKRGHLTTVTKKSIFDIEGIKDSNTGDYVSFNQAKKLGIIDQVTGKFNEHKTNRKISFLEASSKDLLQPQLLEMLKKPIGIYSADKKRELSLLEAVNEGLVDTHSGLLIDTSTNKTLPMDKALELQLISPMGVAVLKSLLNITVTSATVTQTVKRYIQVSNAGGDSGAITFQDALRRGLIDDATGIFTHPDTGKELLLDEAIHLGLLKLSPTSSLKSSPVATSDIKRSVSKESEGRFTSTITRSDSHSSIKESQLSSEFGNQNIVINTNGGSSNTLHTNTNGGTTKSSASTSRPRTPVEQTNKQSTTINNRSSSLETKSTSSKTSSIKSAHAQSSSLTRKSSRATSEFRNIPIEINRSNSLSGHKQSTPSSPTKPGQPLPVFDMPASGYSLKDAIDTGLFDTTTGMYQENLVLLEAITQGYINATSATVATTDEHGKGITLTLKKALEEGVVTQDGQYNDGRKLLPMQEAIMNGKIWHVWKSSAQKTAENKKAAQRKLKKEKEEAEKPPAVPTPEPPVDDNIVEISKGILFDKNTNTFQFSKDITAADLLQALKEGKVRPQDIQVKLENNGQCNISEAIRDSILDKATGIYTSPTCVKMTLIQAIHAEYIFIVSAPGFDIERPKSINLNQNRPISIKRMESTIRDGTIKARIVESGVTTTRISTFMVEVPGTGEEITLEEALKRGLISEETAAMYAEEISTDSQVQSIIVLITCPETGIEMKSEEAIAKGIVTEAEVEAFLRMANKQRMSKTTEETEENFKIPEIPTIKKASAGSNSSSSGSSSSSSDETDRGSYRSEITIDFGASKTSNSTEVKSTSVVLLQGYVLSNLDEVRNLKTGETMSIYEAKLRGIATDAKIVNETNQIKVYLDEAVSRGLVNFGSGTFTNPTSGEEMSIGEAIQFGILITEIRTQEEDIMLDLAQIGFNEALKHCFDSQTRLFKSSMTLTQSVESNWINSSDIIYDTASNSCCSLKKAMEDGLIKGETCDYRVNEEYMLILDAAAQGHCAIFPEPEPEIEHSDVQYSLREAIEKNIYNSETCLFQEMSTLQALRIGLVDFRSAEVLDTSTKSKHHLLEAIDRKILDGKTAKVKDLEKNEEMTLLEAYERGLLNDQPDTEWLKSSTNGGVNDSFNCGLFECISFWEAIERKQLG